MIYILTFIHIVVSLVLIAVVLLQTGKRADLAGAFGGGGSQTAFGTRGAATFLSKMTTAAAVMFMLTCMALSMVSSKGIASDDSVLTDVEPTQNSAPAVPDGEAGDPLTLPDLSGDGDDDDDSEPDVSSETSEDEQP